MPTNIIGTVSGFVTLLNGKLKVKLDAPIITQDVVNPDTIYFPVEDTYTVTGGVVNINVPQTETSGVTCQFTFYTVEQLEEFYFEDGQQYFGPTHLHTDTYYYTGTFHSTDSVRVDRQLLDNEAFITSFHAIVPNRPTVEFAELIPTGVQTDRLASGARQIAALLAFDSDYRVALADAILRYRGTYDPLVWYEPREWVFYGGSSWYSKWPDPHIGNTPTTGSDYWTLLAGKGDPGGTGGNDTAYDATGWNGQTDAPSRNAVRDVLVTLAPLASPTFTGTPVAPTAAANTNTTQLATCANVVATILARLTDAALTGNPTAPDQDPNVSTGTNGGRVANCSFVKNSAHRYSRLIDSKAQGTAGGTSTTGINTRDLNTIDVNAGDVVSLTSNTFTLRPGTYRISASAPAFQSGVHRIFLWNNDNSTRVLNGQNAHNAPADSVTTPAQLRGRFTIASNTAFQIRHYVASGTATNGLGVAVNESGVAETYAVVELWRVD